MSPAEPKIAKSYMTTHEAAQCLGVSLRTAQLWAEQGLLTHWKTSGGHRRIERESVNRLLADRGGSESANRQAALAPAEKHPKDLQILVVDDDADLLRLYRLQMVRWSCRPAVQTASSGFEALVRIGAHPPDLLVVDLQMPGMDGFQMLRALRAMAVVDTVEIVVVTGLAPEQLAARGGVPAGIPVMGKPVVFAELERIAQRLAGGTPDPWAASPA